MLSLELDNTSLSGRLLLVNNHDDEEEEEEDDSEEETSNIFFEFSLESTSTMNSL